MMLGTGNPHTSSIMLGNAVNTQDNNLFDEWEMKHATLAKASFTFALSA